MAFSLRKALDNYRAERHRLAGGHYPHVSCKCAFCDVIRAADLLFDTVEERCARPQCIDRLPPDPQRRLRN